MDRLNYLWILTIVFLASCAQIVSPTGGEKDTQPPQLVKESPANSSLNFNSKSFYLEFDEYVQLNDINSQLIISPPLEDRPDVQLRKKGVLISWKEDLKENTTYTFNFGEGIADVNEGNPASVQYVFSTGPEMDSLVFVGKVSDAFDSKPLESVKVMLYDSFEDSLPMMERPYYFSRTNADGNFRISNIKEGEYKAFALLDENGNYFYDSPAEKIGFTDFRVSPQQDDSTLVPVEFHMSSEGFKKQFITDDNSLKCGYTNFFLNREIDSLHFEFIGQANPYYHEIDEEDSIHVWLLGEARNTELRLAVFDAEEALDTLYMPFFEEEFQDLNLKCPPGRFDKNNGLSISTDALIDKWDTSLIEVIRDSIPLTFNLERSKGSQRKLLLDFELKDGENYKMTFFPGAVTSIYGMTNDTLVCRSKAFESDHYGNLDMVISETDLDGPVILQLYDQSGELAYERSLKGPSNFWIRRLEPGSYTLLILHDRDGSGDWTPCNYLNKRQPEKRYFYPKEVNVRSNWDLKINWDLIIIN